MQHEPYLLVESEHVAHHLPGVRLLQDITQQPCLRLKQVLKDLEKNYEMQSEQPQASANLQHVHRSKRYLVERQHAFEREAESGWV